MKSQEIDTATEYLESQGWNQYEDNFYPEYIYFCRQSAVEPSCFLNQKGLQITVSICILDFPDNTYCAWTIGIKAMTVTENWVDFKFYGLDLGELESKLEPLSQSLILAWQSVAN
jgi:hypothetical protein